jgi:hypothetical protein
MMISMFRGLYYRRVDLLDTKVSEQHTASIFMASFLQVFLSSLLLRVAYVDYDHQHFAPLSIQQKVLRPYKRTGEI